jgi:hypothetical protein
MRTVQLMKKTSDASKNIFRVIQKFHDICLSYYFNRRNNTYSASKSLFPAPPPDNAVVAPSSKPVCYSNWIKNVSLILARLLFLYGILNNCIIMYSVSYI